MKRKLLALIVGASLIMSTGLTAMAAEMPASETAAVATIAFDIAEIKEGLQVSALPDLSENASKDGEAPAAYFGVISKEDLSKIISELNLSSEKSEELMIKFDKNMELQDQLQALYSTVTGEATEDELQKIHDEADKISNKMEDIIVGDVLNKAIELELLEEAIISICPEKIDENEIFQVSTESFSMAMTVSESFEK